jgi:hypothetical protein
MGWRKSAPAFRSLTGCSCRSRGQPAARLREGPDGIERVRGHDRVVAVAGSQLIGRTGERDRIVAIAHAQHVERGGQNRLVAAVAQRRRGEAARDEHDMVFVVGRDLIERAAFGNRRLTRGNGDRLKSRGHVQHVGCNCRFNVVLEERSPMSVAVTLISIDVALCPGGILLKVCLTGSKLNQLGTDTTANLLTGVASLGGTALPINNRSFLYQ